MTEREQCYSGAFSPTRERCPNRGVYTTRIGNLVDNFVWCHEHAPSAEWRVPIEARAEAAPMPTPPPLRPAAQHG
ncbi:MAG TPA: hypothetical protein VFR23_24490 [Jiangellaceae bacterium]|nr:hypothetical protein [Jiangellaceae bacterium]